MSPLLLFCFSLHFPMSAPSVRTPLQRENSKLLVHFVSQEGRDLVRACETLKDILDRYPKIILYGKEVHQRRSVGFFSDVSKGYRYSRSIAKAKPMTPELRALLDFVNDFLGATFNGILINFYETGEDYISKHSDDEQGLDPVAGVAALTLGAERKFRIRDKESNEILLDLPTKEDELIQMTGDFQRFFTHEIPKQKNMSWRMSFTFRLHKD